MDRTEFEALRDLPGKKISRDIVFRRLAALQRTVVADEVPIENSAGVELRLNLRYNPERGSKTINVVLSGLGAICRLDVDGPPHAPAGPSHKHSFDSQEDLNLRARVLDRPDLSGQTLAQLFEEFCRMARIEFSGRLEVPPEAGP